MADTGWFPDRAQKTGASLGNTADSKSACLNTLLTYEAPALDDTDNDRTRAKLADYPNNRVNQRCTHC